MGLPQKLGLLIGRNYIIVRIQKYPFWNKMAKNNKKLRVLVVDDNEASLKTTGWTMELLGHEVRTEKEGRAAIKTAEAFKPDVVMLDISLRDMSGYDVCRDLKKNPELADTLFIAQTGWNMDEHRVKSEEAGFNYHLVKPVDIGQLEKLLNSSTALKSRQN